MKRFLLIIALIITFSSASAQSTIEAADAALCKIYDEDQGLREKLQRAINDWDINQIIHYQEAIDKSDASHQAYVTQFIRANEGIIKGLSEKAYSAIFLVIDHADYKYQKKWHKSLRKAALDGLISKSDVATLTDRMLMHKNRKQIYGTQTKAHISEHNRDTVYLWPISKPCQVEQRRQDVGLSTMQEQAEAFKAIGMSVVWNNSLSKSDIKRLTTPKDK